MSNVYSSFRQRVTNGHQLVSICSTEPQDAKPITYEHSLLDGSSLYLLAQLEHVIETHYTIRASNTTALKRDYLSFISATNL